MEFVILSDLLENSSVSMGQYLASTQDSSGLQDHHVEQRANNQAACPGFLSRITLQILSGDEKQCDK